MRVLLMLVIGWILLSSNPALAAGDPNKPESPDKAEKSGVLNFEAELIEGQKKTPEIFLQTEVQKPSLESVLYQRKDFNDFHAVDSKLRPRLPDPPRREPRRR